MSIRVFADLLKVARGLSGELDQWRRRAKARIRSNANRARQGIPGDFGMRVTGSPGERIALQAAPCCPTSVALGPGGLLRFPRSATVSSSRLPPADTHRHHGEQPPPRISLEPSEPRIQGNTRLPAAFGCPGNEQLGASPADPEDLHASFHRAAAARGMRSVSQASRRDLA